MKKKSLHDFLLSELEEFLVENEFKKYRAKQIWDWIYNKKVFNIEQMTNLSDKLKNFIKENLNITSLKISTVKDTNSNTKKYLFSTIDGEYIETVLMRHDYGNTVCISSQIGCNVGCKFCASTIDGCMRNLEVGEMIEQINLIEQDGNKVRNVVVMGMGEPFLNFNNLEKFIAIANHPHALNIGARHLTVSTSGITPYIRKFADINIQCRLAVSLHASNDEIRSSIMPINNKYPIRDLLESCLYYQNKTSRRIMFEYIMIENLNDDIRYANELASLLKPLNCIVNIIPINQVKGLKYKKPPKEKMKLFAETLLKLGINTTIRQEYGDDIDAACGQLRQRKKS